MSAQGTLLPSRAVEEPTPALRWSLATRIAFRFGFIYLGLYCLGTQVIRGLMPWSDLEAPDPVTRWPVGPIVAWVAAHVFGITSPLVYFSGSGDKTFDWVFAFCLLLFAALVTALWSILDRRRGNYVVLHKWFRLFLRFCLAGQMLGYGLAKAIPLQMPYPPLTRLVEPFGNFSMMGVLWYSIGAAPAYEIFAGCAETLGGILLIFPRTVTLGALISLADMTQVFVLNMTYDVPVKLFTFHLIVICLFLLAPDLQRLSNLLLLDRPAGPSTQPPLFASARRNRIALAAQIAFGALLFGMNLYGSVSVWSTYGPGQPKSALYGIWDVTELTIDGQSRPPLVTDRDRWRRAIFEIPHRVTLERMDDTLARYGASIDPKGNTLTLSKPDDKNWKATFAYQRPTPEQLILDGNLEGHKVHLQLDLVDSSKFLLVSRGFHWVQEYPFNR
jgi:hypothetical protein